MHADETPSPYSNATLEALAEALELHEEFSWSTPVEKSTPDKVQVG